MRILLILLKILEVYKLVQTSQMVSLRAQVLMSTIILVQDQPVVKLICIIMYI